MRRYFKTIMARRRLRKMVKALQQRTRELKEINRLVWIDTMILEKDEHVELWKW